MRIYDYYDSLEQDERIALDLCALVIVYYNLILIKGRLYLSLALLIFRSLL